MTFPYLIGQDIVESAVSAHAGIIIKFVNGGGSAYAAYAAYARRLDDVPALRRQVPEPNVTKAIGAAIKGARESDALEAQT
ncbi:MAG: hypothetical protein WAT23_20635 [Chromatiaceae bacterium]